MRDPSRRGVASYLSELVVIIVGVLVALAVDRWDGGRRDRALEAEYLQALVADLRSDSIQFAQTYLPALAQKDSALALVAPVVRGAPFTGDTLAFLDAVGLGGRLGSTSIFLLARRTTFDELIATGNLGLIRSAELRAALVAFYADVQVESSRLDARKPNYPMAVHAYYPAELRSRRDKPDVVRAFGVDRALKAFRSPDFEAVMDQELNFLYTAQVVMRDMADRTDTLLRTLEGALNR